MSIGVLTWKAYNLGTALHGKVNMEYEQFGFFNVIV